MTQPNPVPATRPAAARFAPCAMLALGALLAACNDPAAGKARAEVSAAQPAASAVAGSSYKFDESGSKLEFVGSKVTGKHDGSFARFSGTVRVPDGELTRASVSVEIDAASIAADQPKLTGHLKSADFLDVERFAKVRFTSTRVAAGGTNGATHTVTGNLELHGVTRSLSFPATIRVDGEKLSADAEFSLNRKDFGIDYPGKADDLIRDDVLVRLSIRAKPATS
jgi:polyisoprenoid-binding protein YceI